MNLSLETDHFGRLICSISHGGGEAVVTASNPSAAAADLAAAIEDAVTAGCGECYWQEAGGEYRWMFRRDGDQVRLAVLWSAGTLTGWEQVLSAECDLDTFARQVRDELHRVRIQPA